jgi:hypothetical protein
MDTNAIHYDELRVDCACALSRRDFEDALHSIANSRIEVKGMVNPTPRLK